MSGTIRHGSRGQAVEECQELLDNLGFDLGAIDGVFGDGTDEAVREFQKSKNLKADGVVGPQTWKVLREAEALCEDASSAASATTSPTSRPRPSATRAKFTLSLYTHKKGSEILEDGDEWLSAARDLGFSRLYIQTNEQREGHTLSKMGSGSSRKRVEMLAAVCNHVRSYGLEPCIMPWAPRGEQIRETFEGHGDMPSLPSIMNTCGIKRCDWDEEGANTLSSDDVKKMAAYLAQYSQYEWSWDTHAAGFSVSKKMFLEEVIQIGVCQAYHKFDKDDRKGERWWGARHGPGRRQEYAMGRFDKVDAKRVTPLVRVLILALWWQHSDDAPRESGYSTHEGWESILEGVKVAWEEGIEDLRFWRDSHVAFKWTREAIEKMRELGMV